MRSLRLRYLVNLLFPLVVFSGILAFFIYTGPSDLAWLDGAHYQRRVALTEIGEGPWDRPLYVLLSQPFLLVPGGSLPQRASLASAVFAAGACLFVYLLLKALLEVAPQFIARRVGILAAVTLAVSHTFWSRAVAPGPEVLDALILSAILFFLVSFANGGKVGYFYTAMLILGLSLSNNLMMIFMFPFIAIWVRVVKPPLVREIGMVRLRGLLLLVGGSALALVIAAVGWSASGFRIPAEQWSWVTFWRENMMLSWDVGLQQSIIRFSVMLLYNFFPWLIVIGLLGLIELFQRQKFVFWLIFPILVVYSFLAVTLRLPEPIPAYLPVWVLFSIFVGYGWWKALAEASWLGFVVALALSLSPIAIYHYAAPGIERIGEEVRVRALWSPPFEAPIDSVSYYLNPNRRIQPNARAFANDALAQLPERARIAAPSRAGERIVAPVRYLVEVEQARSEMSFESVGPADSEKLQSWAVEVDTPLFLSGLHPPNPAVEGLLGRYTLIPSGYFFQLLPREAPPEMPQTETPVTIVGEWSGFERPEGYSVHFSVRETPDGELAGTAVLNQTSARPLEGTFTRLSLLHDAFLASITYKNRVHIHIDSKITGNRLEGEWQIFEAQYLNGTFTVWRSQASDVSGEQPLEER
jgi:hypothetical protein